MMPLADIDSESWGLSQSVIDGIRTLLDACPEVERALLYGSRAKGTFHRGSDIDLVLEGRQLDDIQVLALENQLDDLLLPYNIDLSRLAAIQDRALLEHIRRAGRVFYER